MGSNPAVEIDHEIFSWVILSHLFKKGHCQFLAKDCTSTGKLLRGLSMPRKSVVR